MRHHALLTAIFLSLILLVAGCAEAPVPEEDRVADRDVAEAPEELDRVYGTFQRAYSQADLQLLMDSVYARDAYYLPPGADILSGQAEIREQFAFLDRFAAQGGGGPEIVFDIVDRDVSGDLAYDIGTYTLTPPGPGSEPARGKFIVVWKRNEQGDWRIHADGFSPLP